MRKLLTLIVLLGSLLSPAADALLPHGAAGPPPPSSVTIQNYNDPAMGSFTQTSHFDTSGNKIDVHTGGSLQVGNTFYMYGESYGCGWAIGGNAAPPCGMNVYSSTDRVNWTSQGYLFDITTAFWLARCFQGAACYEAFAVYNAANNNYVVWFIQVPGSSVTAPDGLYVMTCTLPYSTPATINTNCTKQADPTNLAHGPVTSSFKLFVDTDGTGYVIYNHGSPGALHNYVDRLNASYTDSIGASVDTGLPGEGQFMFVRAGTYYVGTGSIECGLCTGGAPTSYASGLAPLGPYSGSTVLNANTCNGQVHSVDVISAGGFTTYLLVADQWQGYYNEGLANLYQQPLTFTGNTIDTFTCQPTVTIQGLSATPPPPPSPAPDSSAMGDQFYNQNGIEASGPVTHRLQTFVAQHTTLSKVIMPLGQGCEWGITTCPNTAFTGNYSVNIVTLDGSNNPVSILGTVSLTAAQLANSWAPRATTLTFSLTGLTIGASYGIELVGPASNGSGEYAIYNGPTNPYPAGIERYSTNGGSTWITETNAALAFQVYQ